MSQLIEGIAQQFDKLPPHSIPAEMSLLASMMLEKNVIAQVIPLVDRNSFYQTDHQIIYDLLIKLYEQNRPIDAVIVLKSCRGASFWKKWAAGVIWPKYWAACPPPRTGCITPRSSAKGHVRQLIAASNDILRSLCPA